REWLLATTSATGNAVADIGCDMCKLRHKFLGFLDMRILPRSAGIYVACAVVLILGCSPKQPADGRIRVGGLVFQEDQYMRLIQCGLRDEAEKQNVDLMMNNTFNTLDREISLIDTYVSSHVNAVAVAPLSSRSSIEELKRAHDAGIVVVTFDNYIDAD